MGSITKYKGSQYRVFVRLKPFKSISRVFSTYSEAKEFSDELEYIMTSKVFTDKQKRIDYFLET